MVATVSQLHGGNATYYTKGYYLDGQAEGEWLETRAADALGLTGNGVTPRAFERLLRGFHPRRDEELVQNAGGTNRQLGWDLQFGVDKSFSVLYAMVPELRAELESCLKEAVRSTVLNVVETEFLETRRGPGGRIREPVSAPVALFLHRTNRENEIHLHCHAPMPNVGVREDGTTGTIVSKNFYEAKLALGKAFHARYAELVEERLGIACEFDERGLSRVRGFPGPVAEALSSPSRRIRDLAPDDSSKAKEEANLRQRQTKAELPLDEVAEACRRRAEELGFSAEDARKFLGVVSRENRPGELEATRHFLRGVVAGLSSEFTKAELFERTFREGARAGLPFAELYSAARETLEDPEAVEPLGRVGGKEKFRKLEGVEFLPGRDEMSRGFHEFLEQIIASTPELDVAEFLPPPPVQGGSWSCRPPGGASRTTANRRPRPNR